MNIPAIGFRRMNPGRLIAGLVVAALAIALVACSEPAANSSAHPPPPQVSVSPPIRKEIVEWDEYTGRVEAVETVEVRARVGGYLEKVNFKDGSLVRKGDLLFVIDPRPYQAELDRVRGDLARAQARRELARNDLARAQRLFEKRAISEEELDTRDKSLREAIASVQSAQGILDRARLNLEFTEVRAPISGRISRELVTEGNLVNDGTGTATLLTTIVSVDPVYVYVDADEQSVLKYRKLAREGKLVSARDAPIPAELALANDEGYPHRGIIDFVDNRLDPNTGTLRARGVFENPEGDLIPGFFARLRLPGSGKYSALLVPDRALAMNQGQQYVLVVNARDTAEFRKVATGPMIDGLRVVTEGLQPEDRVIVDGMQRVRPGMPVRAETVTSPSSREAVALANSPLKEKEPRREPR